MNYYRNLWILLVFSRKPVIFLNKPLWKWSHRIENTILHRTWPKLESGKIHRRISISISLQNFWNLLVFWTIPLTFSSTPAWNLYQRIENWVLHRTQPNLKWIKIHGGVYTWISVENFEFYSYFRWNRWIFWIHPLVNDLIG